MMMKIYAVRDVQVASYGNPFFMQADGQAIRSFTHEVNKVDKESTIYNHPEDFELYSIGTYDTDTGVIVPEVVPLCAAKSVAIR